MKQFSYIFILLSISCIAMFCYNSGGAKSLGQHLSVDRKADEIKIDNINKNDDVASDRNQDDRLILVTLIPNSTNPMYYKNKWDSIRKIIDSECPDNIYTFRPMQAMIIYNRWIETGNEQLDKKLGDESSSLVACLSNGSIDNEYLVDYNCEDLLEDMFKYLKEKKQSGNKYSRLLGLDVHTPLEINHHLSDVEPYSLTRFSEIYLNIIFGHTDKAYADLNRYLEKDSVRLKKLLGEEELFLWRYTAKEYANEHDEYYRKPEKLDSVMCRYYHDLKKRFKGSNLVIAQPGLIKRLEKEMNRAGR